MIASTKNYLDNLLIFLESKRGFVLISILMCLFTFVGLYFMSNFERANDDWEHLAAMRSFADAPFDPTHPYSFDTEYSHLFTPYHFLWGLVARILNISPFFLSPFIGLLNVFIFIISVRCFANKFLKNSNLASLLLLTMLFLWLLAPGYSGFYQFSHLMKTAIYPYRLAFSLSLISLSFFPNRTLYKNNIPLVLIVPIIFLIHPLTGVFLIITLATQIWFLEKTELKTKVLLMTVLVISLAFVVLWPFFPVLSTIMDFNSFKNSSFSGQFREFYQGQFVYCVLPSIPGIYFLIKYFPNDHRIKTIGTSLLIFLIIYTFNFFILETTLGGRVMVYIVFSLQILIILGFSHIEGTRELNILKKIYYLGIFILVLPQLFISWKSMSFIRDMENSKPLGHYSNFNHVRRLEPLADKIERNKILVAPINESWILPTITGVKVHAIKHSDPFVDPYHFKLRNDVIESFYNNDCDPGILINQKTQFDYILIPKGKSILKVQESYPNLTIIYADSAYTLMSKRE